MHFLKVSFIRILIQITINSAPRDLVDNKSALVQVMPSHQTLHCSFILS